MNNKDDMCVSRSRLRNAGNLLIAHYFDSCEFCFSVFASCGVNAEYLIEADILSRTGAWAHMWRHTRVHRSTHREVCGISKWKWKFEPQVWHSVTYNQRRWQTFFEWLYAQPDRWLLGDFFLAAHVGPRHALLSLIIVLHYLWVPPPLKSWHAAGLADTPPCFMHLTPGPVPRECKEAAFWTSMSLRRSSFVFSSFRYSYSWYLKQFSS